MPDLAKKQRLATGRMMTPDEISIEEAQRLVSDHSDSRYTDMRSIICGMMPLAIDLLTKEGRTGQGLTDAKPFYSFVNEPWRNMENFQCAAMKLIVTGNKNAMYVLKCLRNSLEDLHLSVSIPRTLTELESRMVFQSIHNIVPEKDWRLAEERQLEGMNEAGRLVGNRSLAVCKWLLALTGPELDTYGINRSELSKVCDRLAFDPAAQGISEIKRDDQALQTITDNLDLIRNIP